MRREQKSNDQRLTIYLPDGAVAGRMLRVGDTMLEAYVERAVPRDERFRFTLHMQNGVVAGEVTCIGQEERVCRLQFTALTAGDRSKLAPFLDPDL